MKLKIAFAGFRHIHINSLHAQALRHPELEVVAACEENPAEAGDIISGIKITHNNFEEMLRTVPIDIIASGDYFSKRGSILIRSLREGKHVILDKPVCTSLSELEQAAEQATAKNLKIGCQLDLRQQPNLFTAREIVRSGDIGEILAVSFGGQHPLMRGSRPGWYFEPGKHGGTINDIGVHGIDMTEWMTGLRFTEINAARTWNAIPKDRAFFNDAGQFMLTMENGCGVLGDVSYFSPDSCGYSLPYYWNFMFWGTKGVIRASPQGDTVELALNGRKNLSHVSRSTQAPCDYLTQFLLDIKGRPGDLNTETVLRASRTALKVQETADKKNPGVRLV